MATKKQERPIKLIFKTEKEKENILVKYKDVAHNYDRVYMRNDYSTDERCKIKSFVEEAKRKNSENGHNNNIKWKVRGCPRKSLYLAAVISNETSSRHSEEMRTPIRSVEEIKINPDM